MQQQAAAPPPCLCRAAAAPCTPQTLLHHLGDHTLVVYLGPGAACFEGSAGSHHGRAPGGCVCGLLGSLAADAQQTIEGCERLALRRATADA